MRVLALLLCTSVFLVSCIENKNSESIFDAPDQVLWHAKSKTWFVSNLGGGISLEKDGYGWITRLNESGEVINARWIDSLDAPSGMISNHDKLFVCDRSGVYQIDIEKGEIESEILLPDAEFVNDVCISPEGDLYVSDFFGNKIYRISAKTSQPEVFLELDESPDGLYMDSDTLVIVTWGKISNKATFETSQKGKILLVDVATKQVSLLLNEPLEIGNLEGVTKDNEGNFYVSDWMSGKLLKINEQGAKTVLSGLQHPTDPDYSPELNVLALPEHKGNRVIFYHLNN